VTSYLVERHETKLKKEEAQGEGALPIEDSKPKLDNEGDEENECLEGKWHRIGSTHFTHMVAYRLKEEVSYRFRVRAENTYGLSEASGESEALTLKQAPADINYDALGEGLHCAYCTYTQLIY